MTDEDRVEAERQQVEAIRQAFQNYDSSLYAYPEQIVNAVRDILTAVYNIWQGVWDSEILNEYNAWTGLAMPQDPAVVEQVFLTDDRGGMFRAGIDMLLQNYDSHFRAIADGSITPVSLTQGVGYQSAAELVARAAPLREALAAAVAAP